jgi:8-oxo-dGTP pyrophosphatase MutT (NUDIX family)
MTNPVHKVTCFITRSSDNGTELLLFSHPNSGIQIPAGTVNPGEDIESAARREATEESGLVGLTLIRKLGMIDDPPPPNHLLVTLPTRVYSRPHTNSFDWAYFRSGLPVEVLRHEAGFTQVRYEEKDRTIDPLYATYTITGWVPDRTLTDQRMRHFYLFHSVTPTSNRWSVETDNHVFDLFWAPLDKLPSIVPTQDGWLKWLTEADLIGFRNM